MAGIPLTPRPSPLRPRPVNAPYGSAPTAPNNGTALDPVPAVPPVPTFQPAQPDPRIAQLTTVLQRNAELPPAAPNAELDRLRASLTPQHREANSFDALMSELAASGQAGGPIGDISGDPEAVSYRNARTTQARREQEAAAARGGASGEGPNSGDLTARTAQIQEASGQDIANFEGNLTGRLRTERTQHALAGAQLGLSREAADRSATQASIDSILHQQEADRNASMSVDAQNRQQQQELLNTLLNQQGRDTETGIQLTQLPGSLTASALANEMAKQDLIQKRKQTVGGYPVGTSFTRTGAARLPA